MANRKPRVRVCDGKGLRFVPRDEVGTLFAVRCAWAEVRLGVVKGMCCFFAFAVCVFLKGSTDLPLIRPS